MATKSTRRRPNTPSRLGVRPPGRSRPTRRPCDPAYPRGVRPPSVDALARSLADTGLPHPLLVDAARAAIGRGDPDGARAEAEAVAAALLRPVVNATGVLLHTNLGRAPLAHEQDADLHEPRAGPDHRRAGVPGRPRRRTAGPGLWRRGGDGGQQRGGRRAPGPGRPGPRPGRGRLPGRAGGDRRRLPDPGDPGHLRRPPRRGGDHQPDPAGRLRAGRGRSRRHRPAAEGPPVQLPDHRLHRGGRPSSALAGARPAGGRRPRVGPARRRLPVARRRPARRGCGTSRGSVRPSRPGPAWSSSPATSCWAGPRPGSSPAGPTSSPPAPAIPWPGPCAPAAWSWPRCRTPPSPTWPGGATTSPSGGMATRSVGDLRARAEALAVGRVVDTAGRGRRRAPCPAPRSPRSASRWTATSGPGCGLRAVPVIARVGRRTGPCWTCAPSSPTRTRCSRPRSPPSPAGGERPCTSSPRPATSTTASRPWWRPSPAPTPTGGPRRRPAA